MARVRYVPSRINPRLVGAGAAGIAAVFAVAPFAGAATPPSPTPSAAPAHHGTVKMKAPRPAVTTSTVTADFGLQKFRVGVQVKSGAYVATDGTPPDGRSTVGSQVHVVEKTSGGTVVNDQTCTTELSTLDAGARESYCRFVVPSAVRRAALARGATRAQANDLSSSDYYWPAPGNTVTLTQTKAMPDLVIDSVTQTRGPTSCNCTTDPVNFVDPGLPPVANDDHATTKVNTPVVIDVFANDDAQGAPATIALKDPPAHGGTVLVTPVSQNAQPRRAAPSRDTFRYEPATGFVGHDQFTYTLTTANGSSVATVFVTVKAPPPTAVDDSASTTSGVPVTIAVTSNDNAHGGGKLTLKSVGDPSHGTVKIDGNKTVYTSDADFTGKDTYVYTVSTAYGTATATVTVTVTAPASTPTPSPSSSSQPLATTGVPTATLGEIGIGLLAIGGVATAVGRRRRRGNHA